MRSPADRFVGRQREIAELTAAMAKSPVVTVVGPPGVGKTRLVLEVAANFDGEVVVVELAPITDPSGVVGALASALGAKQSNYVVLEESITVSLTGRHVLVVLDNCEHFLESCRTLVEQLRTSANSGLRLVVTSREPLRANREIVYRLHPLSVPPAELDDVTAIASHEAVALFVDRATHTNPGFILNETNAMAVAEICRHLDGIPLAIELAAARANLLTPEQLALMLAERFNVLGQTSPNGISHHETLEAAVAWSYGLLSPSEMVLMRRLSVFSGAIASAAEEVCAGSGLGADEVAGLLGQLSARSLVAVDRSDHGVRYRQLQAVRHFAAERLLEAGEAVEARNRHARWAITLAERAEPELTGPDQDVWLYLLDTEADNLRSAMAWLIRDEQLEAALRIGGSLTLWWRARGQAQEGRDLMMDAFRLDQMVESKAVLAKALWGAGYLDYVAGTANAEWDLCLRALDWAYYAGDDSIAARALLVVAAARVANDDTPDNLRMLAESCRLAQGKDSWCLAHALALRGLLKAQSLGDEIEGRRLVEEAVAVARDAGDTQSLIYALGCLSILVIRSGSPSAPSIVEEELALCHDRPHERASALLHLGRLRARDGDVVRAESAFEESTAAFRRLGNPDPAWEVWVAQARLARVQGDSERARRLLLDAQASLDRSHLVAVEVLVELAYLAVEEGHLSTAQDLATRAVDSARVTPVPGDVVRSLLCQAVVSRVLGRLDDALAQAREATLTTRTGPGNEGLLLECTTVVATLALAKGDIDRATPLYAAIFALHRGGGRPMLHPQPPHHQADLARLRARLDPARFELLWGQGSEWSLGEAVNAASEVLGIVEPVPQGWGGLTKAETAIADLAAEGLSNREISEKLCLSPHSVRSYMTRIFSRLSVTSRSGIAQRRTMALALSEYEQGAAEMATPDRGEAPRFSLRDFEERFANEAACHEWLWRARFSPDGVHALCPGCGVERSFHRLVRAGAGGRWDCDRCNFQVRPRAGTVFGHSSTPLPLWLQAAYLVVATDGAITAKQLQREIGVSYKAAWRMANMIRAQIASSGEVETGAPVPPPDAGSGRSEPGTVGADADSRPFRTVPDHSDGVPDPDSQSRRRGGRPSSAGHAGRAEDRQPEAGQGQVGCEEEGSGHTSAGGREGGQGGQVRHQAEASQGCDQHNGH